jgi:hypothetical protein
MLLCGSALPLSFTMANLKPFIIPFIDYLFGEYWWLEDLH